MQEQLSLWLIPVQSNTQKVPIHTAMENARMSCPFSWINSYTPAEGDENQESCWVSSLKKKKSANAPNPPNTAFLTLSPEYYFIYRKIETQDFQTLTTRFGHWVFWSR